MALDIHKKALRGDFILLPTKKNITKNSQFCWGRCLDLFCQSVKWWRELHHWGTLWRYHCLISLPAPSLWLLLLSLSPSLSLPLFVQFWYADRPDIKKGFPWRQEGPADVAWDKANTNSEALRHTEKLAKNKQAASIYIWLVYLYENAQEMPSIFIHFKSFSSNFWPQGAHLSW